MTEYLLPSLRDQLPLLIEVAGDSARFAWEEFFYAKIRSEHTRRAYMRAVRYFLRWCEDQSLALGRISPAHVGLYLDDLQVSISSKKQVLAGLRHFFDGMVMRHAITLNPALSVRTERYSVLEGKTPGITVKQARGLLQSIDTSNIIGLRDKCIIAILIYTAARIGAVSKLKVNDLYDAGDQFCLHFLDKGGKSREIPVRHDLQTLLYEYQRSIDTLLGPNDHRPLFTTTIRRSRELTLRSMTTNDIGRMVKRRMKSAGSEDRTAILWNAIEGKQLTQFVGHIDAVTSIAFNSDSKVLVTGSEDHTALVWNCETGKRLHTLKQHTGQVHSVDISPDGHLFVTGSADSSAIIWNQSDGRVEQTLVHGSDEVEAVTFSPDGKTVATATDRGFIALWNSQSGTLFTRFKFEQRPLVDKFRGKMRLKFSDYLQQPLFKQKRRAHREGFHPQNLLRCRKTERLGERYWRWLL